MPDISPVYMQIAEKNINILHIKCTKGIYTERLFKTIINGSSKYYPLNKIEWMKEFLLDQNQNLSSSCLECLYSKGMKLNEVEDILRERIKDNVFSLKAIELAEKENNPEILLIYMEEEYGYINRIILALKNTGNESYLTTLMLSENEKLAKAICRITSKKDDKK